MLTSDYLLHKIYAGTYIILALLLQHLLMAWSILKSMGILLWLYWGLNQDVILIQHTWYIMVESIAKYLYSLPSLGFAGDFREIFADNSGLGFLCLNNSMWLHWHLSIDVWEGCQHRNFCPVLVQQLLFKGLTAFQCTWLVSWQRCSTTNTSPKPASVGKLAHCFLANVHQALLHSTVPEQGVGMLSWAFQMLERSNQGQTRLLAFSLPAEKEKWTCSL